MSAQTPQNIQMEMESILAALAAGRTGGAGLPRLLLHSCCAPCSSSVLEMLAPHFAITIDYYNPNIDPPEEFYRRAAEQVRFVAETKGKYPNGVRLLEETTKTEYDPQAFYDAVRGMENEPEGGARCFACYALRLAHTARLAAAGGYDWFTTTLSVSPHKNAAKLYEIGHALSTRYGVAYLPSDFKKKDGYKRSLQLSAQYGLYRQTYCGCVFSRSAL